MKTLSPTMLVAVSGSTQSLDAAKYGIALARLHRSRLLAAYVVETDLLKELVLSRILVEDESADYMKSLEENGRRYLAYVADLGKKKGITVETIMRSGSVSTQIVEAAEENGVGLILIGAYDSPSTHRDIIGRQHREILRNARCSVLVVREPRIEEIYRGA